MSDYIELVKEKAQLDDKLAALCAFKYTHMFGHLPFEEQERLNTQGHFMCAYSAILGERVSFAKRQENR